MYIDAKLMHNNWYLWYVESYAPEMGMCHNTILIDLL